MPHVVFVSPEAPGGQRRFVRALVRAGVRVTGIGESRPDQLDGELRHLLAEYEPVRSIADEDELLAAVRTIQARGPWVDRLECTVDAHVLPVARARMRASIPGLSVEQAALSRDKLAMKQFLAARGVGCAAHAEVRTAEEVAQFGRRHGYPLVLKPRIGGGAADARRLSSEEEVAGVVDQLVRGTPMVVERFVDGHEGFWDALTVDGQVVHEFASHYYPTVMEALQTRWISPQVVHTNRLHLDGYEEVRRLGREVVGHLGLGTTAAHLEWFHGSMGHLFSELGARPPAGGWWDVYEEANELDLYGDWARALCWGRTIETPSHRFSAGLINLRPSHDGVVQRYVGVERMQRAYGEFIFRMHLPPPGTPTQPIGAGYFANAWVCVKHPDYDRLREMLDDIGRTVKCLAG